jgi:hypothetical protein
MWTLLKELLSHPTISASLAAITALCAVAAISASSQARLRAWTAAPAYRSTTLIERGAIVIALGGAALPIAWYLNIAAFAARAALHLGRWPAHDHPDPKDLPSHFLPALERLDWMIPCAVAVVGVCLGLWLLRRVPWPSLRPLLALLALVSTWLLTAFLLIHDPGGLIEWLFD